MDFEKVTIGKYCSISSAIFVTHSGADRIINAELGLNLDTCKSRNIVVEDYCAIGAGAIIHVGVTIGSRSIVGCGAVVRKNIPEDSIVIGNPAIIIDSRKAYIKRHLKDGPQF